MSTYHFQEFSKGMYKVNNTSFKPKILGKYFEYNYKLISLSSTYNGTETTVSVSIKSGRN